MKWTHVLHLVLGLAASTARYLSSPFPDGSENPVVALMALNAPVLLWLMRGLDGFLERDRALFAQAPKPQPPTEVSERRPEAAATPEYLWQRRLPFPCWR